MVFGGAPAQALLIHKYEAQITEIPAEGPHKETIAKPGPLAPTALASEPGVLYVGDPGRVDEFDASSGAFLSQPSLPGVTFGEGAGERHVYNRTATGVAVFGPGVCGSLECSVLQQEWTGADTPNESFTSEKGEGSGRITGVAVDNSKSQVDWAKGDVFVATRSFEARPNLNVVDVFKPEAGGSEKYVATAQLTGIAPGEPFEGPSRVAVSGFNGDVLVVDGSQFIGRDIDVFEPVGVGKYTFVRQIVPPHVGAIEAVTVDAATGEIYAGGQAEGGRAIDVFGVNGESLNKIGSEETPSGGFFEITSLAVDPGSHRVFVGDIEPKPGFERGFVDEFSGTLVPDVATGSVSGVHVETAKHTWGVSVAGTVNSDNGGEASCQVVYGTSPSFGSVAPCTHPVPDGSAPVPVEADLEGLEPGTTYFYRLQASNAHGTNGGEAFQDQQYRTPGPGLHSESVSDVSSSSVSLDARIDPDGASSSYRFEYDTRAYAQGEVGHGTKIPAAPVSVGAGSQDLSVEQHVQGLSPNATYHYRLVVFSEYEAGKLEEFDGPDETFSTQGLAGSFSLLDGRAWELVSPPDKHGALIFGLVKFFSGTLAPLQASGDGSGITYETFTPTELNPGGFSDVEQVLSKRNAAGWFSRDISPPHHAPTGYVGLPEYQFFSGDLTQGLVNLPGVDNTLLSSQASEATPYAHQEFCELSSGDECYVPLVTGKNSEVGDVPPGTVFGGPNQVEFVGASPDMRHVMLKSPVALTGTATGGHEELYEWSVDKPASERLQLVSLLPEAEGGGPVTGSVDIGNTSDQRWSSGVRPVSGDGSRVFWTAGGSELYMRDVVRGVSTRLDVPQPGAAGGDPGALFQVASADGSRVFFTDAERLTLTSSPNGADLYECEIVEDKCALKDLTTGNVGSSSEVQNIVLGGSEDGSYVYFVANGVLAGAGVPAGVGHGTCRTRSSSASDLCNLYVYHDGQMKFIAGLSGEDELAWGGENEIFHSIGFSTARVSPDGRFVAFMSVRSLTGYDNHDVRSGKPDMEVYEYDAVTERLACVSCDSTGARPAGVEVGSVLSSGADLAGITGGPSGTYGKGTWVAANLPPGTPLGTFNESLYSSRVLSDSGRLFFDSSDGLVPSDVNGQQDVYEFEPAGIGSCSASDRTFRVGLNGCTSLVSSGTAAGESGFLDASASGSDVFFLTGDKLVGEDYDTALDVYDARVCSGSDPCAGAAVSPPACATADACRPAPSVQPSIFDSPSSATFSGAGNVLSSMSGGTVGTRSLTRAQKLGGALSACRHKYRRSKRRRGVCERQAYKRYGAKQSRKARVKRGSGR
jgi:hypothetical protein